MSKQPIYNEEFKKQIVNLYKNGKTALEISSEYKISKATVYTWSKNYGNTGSFKINDNRSEQERDLIRLRKENKQLLMENDILKQAALIMARK